MSTGADYAFNPHPAPAALKAAGVTFVCRYLSHDPAGDLCGGKILSPAEKTALLAAGLPIVLVWEYEADAPRTGLAHGITDATAADLLCRGLGMAGAVVYFAADWDVAETEQAALNAYLDGAASVIGRARTGLYGGYWPLSRARAAGKAPWLWGTVAWSGTNWQTCGWKPHVMQGGAVHIGGADCDWDTSNTADFGQWPRPKGPTLENLPGRWKQIISIEPEGTGWVVAGIGTDNTGWVVHVDSAGTARGLKQIFGPVTFV